MTTDLMRRRRWRFLLWRPGVIHPPPAIVFGRFDNGEFREEGTYFLSPEADHPDLWSVDPFSLGLDDGPVHYFFEVEDTLRPGHGRVRCGDPFATCVDYRAMCESSPAAVALLRDNEIFPCDPDGSPLCCTSPIPLAPNNRIVIYELPTTWTRGAGVGGDEFGVGTFADVLALLDVDISSKTFGHHEALGPQRAHILDLGVNALELLPPADAGDKLRWGYGTRHHLAPDFFLGDPENAEPMPLELMTKMRKSLAERGIRYFYDAVMAFSKEAPYRHINYEDFLVRWHAGDPEQGCRDAFGGDLIKYRYEVESYDPVSGDRKRLFPSRQWMMAHLMHWLDAYGYSGLRIDSISNIDCWDFVGDVTRTVREIQGLPDDRFIVVGEELSLPPALLEQHRVDAVWNDEFKYLVRHSILGLAYRQMDFQQTVESMVDCRRLPGFGDLSQAVNYVTSHDVGNDAWSGRLYNFLQDRGVWDTAPRFRLAFACLLTAVGIPMFLAGEEFADQEDLPITDEKKQVDPVCFGRLSDPWRREIFDFVARLVRLRIEIPALSVNEVEFVHWDLTDGKRVAAWRRGRATDDPVVVVANFSEWSSRGEPYEVEGLPALPAGKEWHDAGCGQRAPSAGCEPLDPWDVRVYVAK